MKISLVALGSRGDVQPTIALGVALQRAGYQIMVGAPEKFEHFVQQYGLQFSPIRFPVSAEMAPDVVAGHYAEALDGAQVAILSALARPLAIDICEKNDILVVGALFQTPDMESKESAFAASRKHSAPVADTIPTTEDGKLEAAMRLKRWRTANPSSRGFTATGAPMFHFPQETPRLYGVSPTLLSSLDWVSPNAHVTGYWYLDLVTGWKPPEALLHFLDSGPPPFSISFTTVERKGMVSLPIILEALRQTGQRAVIAKAGLMIPDANFLETVPSSNVLFMDDVPHEWLFPRCVGAIHHAGLGTVSYAVRAGIPSITIPLIYLDQHYWADRLHGLGVATPPLNSANLTVEALVDSIRQILDNPALRENAQVLRGRVNAEDGTAAAMRVIDGILQHRT